ncbi:MAG: sigma-70 family RNA polymerase sigma factor, partial [Phycisphaerales bacterium]
KAHLQGDSEAFGELVRRYGDSLLGYLTKICRNREQAKDLFQETFRKVHEKAHTLKSSHFKSWLYTIATRVAMDSLRRESRVRVVSLNQPPGCDGDNCPELGAVATAEETNDPSAQAVRAEQKEQVRRALESLPDRQRLTVVLAYYQGLSYREVATALDCSIGTVKTQMFRALRTLAQRLPDVSGVAK